MTTRDRLALAAPPLGLAALALAPPLTGGRTVCPIAFLTGTACPGCGMTRAISQLVHGDVEAAIMFHPLVIPTVVAIAVVWAWLVARRLGRASAPSARVVSAAIVGAGIALIGVWALRLGAGTLPPV